ncbi:FkbM family methyltransferase [Microlunatus speluncae]|uniref:FkbM family methyltransferase n=1 Tax=Microlunatus speluncae TaxID=2594267 RepID=UPI001375D30A|nr:FkbM family methyltransferase [Microlunatus speluncae]
MITRQQHRAAAPSRIGLARALRGSAALGLAEPELRGLDQLVRPGDVCFDIGAGYGMYTFPLAELVGRSGQVHSFEPLPVPHRILSRLRAAAGADQVRLHHAALGPRAGDQELTLPYRFGLPIHGWAHLRSGQVGPGRRISFSSTRTLITPVSTVDDVCREQRIGRVRFLKIDVEGFEPSVLAGAERILERDRPSLLLEIEDRHLIRYGRTAAEVAGSLTARGYGMFAWRSGRWTPVAEVTTAGRNYLFSTEAVAAR